MRARALYGSPGTFAIKTGFYKHNREVTKSCCGNEHSKCQSYLASCRKRIKKRRI